MIDPVGIIVEREDAGALAALLLDERTRLHKAKLTDGTAEARAATQYVKQLDRLSAATAKAHSRRSVVPPSMQ